MCPMVLTNLSEFTFLRITTMKNLLTKLAKAKEMIAKQKTPKEWSNDFSHYDYFTPDQVNRLVQAVCGTRWLLTKFDLKRNEYGIYGTLTVYDIESWESLVFEWATAIPEIKATNVAQQIGWCMTYTERYLKMTAFWITDNSLDFDTTENTQKTAKTEQKVFTPNDLQWFNKKEMDELKNNVDWVKWFESSTDLIESISSKYRISKAMKLEIADFWAEVK